MSCERQVLQRLTICWHAVHKIPLCHKCLIDSCLHSAPYGHWVNALQSQEPSNTCAMRCSFWCLLGKADPTPLSRGLETQVGPKKKITKARVSLKSRTTSIVLENPWLQWMQFLPSPVSLGDTERKERISGGSSYVIRNIFGKSTQNCLVLHQKVRNFMVVWRTTDLEDVKQGYYLGIHDKTQYAARQIPTCTGSTPSLRVWSQSMTLTWNAPADTEFSQCLWIETAYSLWAPRLNKLKTD